MIGDRMTAAPIREHSGRVASSPSTSSEHPAAVLGVDLGRVVIGGDSNEDTSFWGARPMETPQIAGAFDSLRRLHELFAGRVFVVSKAGARVEALSRQWLEQHGFHDTTGIGADHLNFVRERADKADVCAFLGITHFIDDRLDVLGHLEGVVAHRFWFAPSSEAATDAAPATQMGVVPVTDWSDAEAKIRSTMKA